MCIERIQIWMISNFHGIGSLNGKVVWISGASSGIGEQLAYDLSKVGAKLILSGHLDTLYTVAEKCLKYSKGKLSSQDILVIPPFDIRETSKHEDVVKDAIKHFGRIDIMINNVGRSQRAKFTEIDISQDKEIFDINVFGQINLTRTVMRHFLERKSGHFVITSSVAGKFGAPYSATYTGSKYALIGYFESIRCEAYSQGIRVTTICPGPIQTPLVERSFHSKTFESEVQGASGKTEGKMSVRRCTFLMLVSIANQLNESWISLKPILWFLYTTQYFPELSKL